MENNVDPTVVTDVRHSSNKYDIFPSIVLFLMYVMQALPVASSNTVIYYFLTCCI